MKYALLLVLLCGPAFAEVSNPLDVFPLPWTKAVTVDFEPSCPNGSGCKCAFVDDAAPSAMIACKPDQCVAKEANFRARRCQERNGECVLGDEQIVKDAACDVRPPACGENAFKMGCLNLATDCHWVNDTSVNGRRCEAKSFSNARCKDSSTQVEVKKLCKREMGIDGWIVGNSSHCGLDTTNTSGCIGECDLQEGKAKDLCQNGIRHESKCERNMDNPSTSGPVFQTPY